MGRMKDELVRLMEEAERAEQAARPDADAAVDSLTTEEWTVRIGQIQSALTFFGALCSISVERADGVTVYFQAQRVDGGLEVEAIGNAYLPDEARLGDGQVACMLDLGWSAPASPDASNFVRFVPEFDDLHHLATAIARSFLDVYGVAVDDEWSVYPQELGLEESLPPTVTLDLDDETRDDDRDRELAQVEEPRPQDGHRHRSRQRRLQPGRAVRRPARPGPPAR